MTPPPGHIILINGASSAGKTTLCRALRDALDIPFLHFSLDFFMFDADVLPRTPQGKVRDWPRIRPHVFGGFYRCLPALLEAGNNLMVDLIIENGAQRDHLRELLAPHDVYLVGLHCPVGELQRREEARGDRHPGEARRDARTMHTFSAYDLEIDCGDALLHNVTRVIGGWTARAASHIWGSGPAGEAAAPRVSASGPVP